ncbi:hypothetical protein ACHAWF_010788 [Thalassiosira exigua]
MAPNATSPRDPLDVSGASSWDEPPLASSAPDAPDADPAAYDVLALRSPLLRRYPSFVPLRRRATSIAEVAFLVPSSDCSSRKATIAAATFNMTATIVGGGVLSIPLSCARAGIVPFTALMILSAAATDFSLYLLVSCARRCGSTSYGSVARAAFGPGLELITTSVIFFLVGCSVVGLMILNQGIWSPVVMEGVALLRGGHYHREGGVVTLLQDAIVLLALLIVTMPLLLKKDLTSLRHICYVGFFSIAILCAAMIYRDVDGNARRPGRFRSNVRWVAGSATDVLSALPIILQAFLCSFNIISVSCSLVNPTRDRVKKVIREAVFLSFLLMYAFGVAGYLFAYDETRGNVLLNFNPNDEVILLGRVGCGITTLFALPMNLLPTREALISLAAQIEEARARRREATTSEERRHLVRRRSEDDDLLGGDGADDARRPRATSVASERDAATDEERGNELRYYGSTTGGAEAPSSEKAPRSVAPPRASAKGEDAIHVTSTLGILLVCYVVAVATPGVAVVWDVTGSSMAFLLQFVIPSACYIRLKRRARRKSTSNNLVLAWFLLVFAVVMSVVCTGITALRLSGKLS